MLQKKDSGKTIEDILYLIVALVSILISLLDFIGSLDSIPWLSERIPTMVLLMIGLLSIYIAAERKNESAHNKHIENLISERSEYVLSSLIEHEYRKFYNADKAFEYLVEKLKNTKLCVDQIAVSPTPDLEKNILQEYVGSINYSLSVNKVTYRYIVDPSYEPRWKRLLEINKKYRKFYLKTCRKNIEETPFLNFFVLDKSEIFMRYPHKPGEPEIYLLIRHEALVELFQAYYTVMWDYANEYSSN